MKITLKQHGFLDDAAPVVILIGHVYSGHCTQFEVTQCAGAVQELETKQVCMKESLDETLKVYNKLVKDLTGTAKKDAAAAKKP